MLAATHLKTLLAYLPAMRVPKRDEIEAALRTELDAATAPIIFAPLPGGNGWHIDGACFRGARLPKGLGLAYAAIRAAQVHGTPPAVSTAHAARKAILTDAMRWARKHAPALVPVLDCISVERGEVLFDTRPGVPRVECLSSA